MNCLEAVVALFNSLKFGRQFVAGLTVGDRDLGRLEAAFGVTARRVGGVAGAERYVRSMPGGVAVPVIYQRTDGSAHVIAAVHAGDGDGVDLLDAQKGEEAEAADVQAATGMWVIPVPGAEVEGEVVLPSSGSRWRGQDEGSGLPAVVTGAKRRGGVSGPVAGKADGSAGRTRGEAGEGSRGVKRRKVDASAAAGAASGSPGDGGSEVRTPTDQAAQQDPSAERKRKQNESAARYRRAGKAAVARVAELEALAERGPLTEEQEAELAELRPEQQQKQKKKESDAKYRRAGKAAVARVAELEALAERRPLTEDQETELAELRPKAQQKQKKKEGDAKRYQARMAAADRVAELEALAERGPLTEEQEAELAELQPKVAQRKQQNTGRDVKYRRARRAEAARVVELEELAGRGPLSEEQAAELAALQPKVAQRKQQESAKSAKYRRARRAEADRVAELEALKEQGPLTEEQEAELAELQPKVAQRKQQNTGRDVKYRRARRAEAARVVELEELRGRGPLTEEQEAELAELQPKAQQLGTRGSGLTIQAGAGPEDQAGRSGESAAGWSSGESGGPSQRHAAVPVDDAAGGAGHQAEREERAELIEEGRVRLAELEAQKAELEELQERAWDPVRQAKLEALPGRIATVQAEVDTLANREAALRDWDERYERAEAQLHEWAGIAGRGAVDRLLADADRILGPLTVSEQFRNVLAHWLGEHPGDWRGAQAVRRELAGYLAGDPDFGVAVSGLPRGAFEEARAEETRWQADRAGD